MPEHTPACDTGWIAPGFNLLGVDGKARRLEELKGSNGTLIMFICNHCPYVKSVIDRVVRDAKELEALGVRTVAICSNDASRFPDDSFDNMKRFAEQYGLSFPYLHDESQDVARAYGAVCTPDFFGFNADLQLQYRGRLDESGREPAGPHVRRELFEAMKQIAESGKGPKDQKPSIGCSINWKAA